MMFIHDYETANGEGATWAIRYQLITLYKTILLLKSNLDRANS